MKGLTVGRYINPVDKDDFKLLLATLMKTGVGLPENFVMMIMAPLRVLFTVLSDTISLPSEDEVTSKVYI